MAIPTSYTYDEFADYLKFEVLRESAETLGFGDTTPEQPALTQNLVVTGTAGIGNTILIEQSQMALPTGSTLTFTGGKVRTLASPLAVGDVSVSVNSGWTGSQVVAGNIYTRTIKAAVARVRNPVYNLITDEVLSQMGLTNINQVGPTNIKFFRLAGRVEILKRAMQSMASEYNYTSPGSIHSRSQVYNQVVELYRREYSRLQRLASLANQPATLGEPDTPESLSGSTDIILVW
jgi:hypothetical protein